MKFTILMGSPRLQGNTAVLCRPFVEELKWCGAEVRYITLADKQILPCRGCYACQNVQGQYGCVLHDDMQQIADDLIWSDCIVLAAPIYAWYCPTSMKLVLDRHYGLNKFYGTAQGSLWAGKRLALLLTHGYEREYATQPFVLGCSVCVNIPICNTAGCIPFGIPTGRKCFARRRQNAAHVSLPGHWPKIAE